MKKVNILGEEWTINYKEKDNNPQFKESSCDGYCDFSIKSINVENFKREVGTLEDLELYKRQVLRHELIHAVLHESGLATCSEWAVNEEMVDFFAKQMPKLIKIFKELEIEN